MKAQPIDLAFPVPLHFKEVGYKNGSMILQLTHYFQYVSSLGLITVPTGTRTDGASVPRVFWNIIGPYGPWFRAAVVHDWLYSPKSIGKIMVTRKQADQIFLEAMRDCGVGWVTRHTIHKAVRAFGWQFFRKA